MSRALALLGLCACQARAPIASCADDLRGVYIADGAQPQRWMVLDDGATLSAYPLEPDVPAVANLEVAPRMLTLARSHDAPTDLAGTLVRRYLQRNARCDARATVHVTRCAADGLTLVVAGDPALPPPPSIAPCQLAAAPSQVWRWRRP